METEVTIFNGRFTHYWRNVWWDTIFEEYIFEDEMIKLIKEENDDL